LYYQFLVLETCINTRLLINVTLVNRFDHFHTTSAKFIDEKYLIIKVDILKHDLKSDKKYLKKGNRTLNMDLFDRIIEIYYLPLVGSNVNDDVCVYSRVE